MGTIPELSESILLALIGLVGVVVGHATSAWQTRRGTEVERDKAEIAREQADLEALRTVVSGLQAEVERLNGRIETMEAKLRAADEASEAWARKYRDALEWARGLNRLVLELIPLLKADAVLPSLPEPPERIRTDL